MQAPWAKVQYMGYFSYEVILTPDRDDTVYIANPYKNPYADDDDDDEEDEDDEEF